MRGVFEYFPKEVANLYPEVQRAFNDQVLFLRWPQSSIVFGPISWLFYVFKKLLSENEVFEFEGSVKANRFRVDKILRRYDGYFLTDFLIFCILTFFWNYLHWMHGNWTRDYLTRFSTVFELLNCVTIGFRKIDIFVLNLFRQMSDDLTNFAK